MFSSCLISAFQRSTTLLALLGLALLLGCGGGGNNPPPTPPSAVAPTISTQPASLTVTAPQPAAFSVLASGTAPLQYQWKKDGAILGTNATTLSLATTTAMDAGSYTVTVSNAAGSVTSTAALLTVNQAASAPTFSTQPASISVVAPTPATFTVVVTGAPSPTLQWQVSTNGGGSFTDLVGATGTSHTTLATSTGDSGRQYRVIATNGSGTATSSIATLTVNAAAVAPTFTTHPANVTITEGQSAQFAVTASGTPAPTLQWQLSTGGGVIWSDITGETATTLTIPNVALASSGWQVRAVASNSQGTATSQAAVLTVQPVSSLANFVFERGYGIQSSPSDLFLIKEDGSGEIPLADSVDHETFLAVAPGRKIVYRRSSSSQTDFYSVNADGSGAVLLVSSAGSTDFPIFNGITPSGWIIYRRDTATMGRDIYAVKADGTSPAPTPLATGINNEDFLAITAGGKVIYSVSRYNGNDLYAINADGTGNTPLATEPNFYKGYKGQTPSGQLVIDTDNGYGSGSIYTMDEGGGSAVTLATNGVAYEYSFAGITSHGQVIISRSVGGQPDLYGNGTVPLAQSADKEFYQGSTATGQVIYRRTTGGSQTDLYLVNADGSNTTLLTAATGDNYFSALTPDGRVIYSKITTGLYDIYMVNADGTGNVPVASSVDFEEYKGMTSDGRVVYERTTNNVTGLYAYNSNNNTTTPLVTSGGHAFFVAITPNDKVLFRRQSGNADLYIIGADGTGMTALANTGNNEFYVAILP